MLLLDAERRTRQSIIDNYDALCIELLGVRGAGLPRERVEELVQRGLLDIESLQGFNVNSSSEPLNPILFIRRIGPMYSRATPQQRARMREYTLRQWQRELKGYEPPPAVRYTPPMDRPTAPEVFEPLEGAIPDSFGTADKTSLVSAFQSVGGYIRGLGARFADEASAIMFEEWNGAQILSTPDPIRRAEMLDVIREEVGAAVLTKDTAKEVARRIRQRSGDLARNFDRIAETELQAVHNEGQVMQAVEIDGDAARVARIPESGACGYCKEAFLGPDGLPKIFSVLELITNGANVGRKRRAWLPSAYPMHPNCRCDTIPVGPNQFVTKTGRIKSVD